MKRASSARRENKPGDTTGERRGNSRGRPTTRAGKVRLRSIDELDQRTAAARKARELVAALESDLGGGDNLSTAQRLLIQRCAMLAAIVEDHEVRWLERRAPDLSQYGTLCDRLRRTLESVGLARVPRDVTPGTPRDGTELVIAGLRSGAA